MPMPVSSTRTSTLSRGAGVATRRRVPPCGIAWQPLIARFRNACRSIAASPLTLGSVIGASTTTFTWFAFASDSTNGKNLLEKRPNADRLELQIFGPREFQKPLHHLVQTTDGALDHFDVLERALDSRIWRVFRRCESEPDAGGHWLRRRRQGATPDLGAQQLEVNHHRVERVLHLVRDAGGQPPERNQLAGIRDG